LQYNKYKRDDMRWWWPAKYSREC